MMQSIAVIRSLRLLPATRSCFIPLARVSITSAGTADAAVHSQDPEGEDAKEAAKAAAAAAAEEKQRRERQQDTKTPPSTDNVAGNIPPFSPSPKLESHEVGRPGDPSFQQKRRWSHAAAPGCAFLEDATCVGIDGSPLAGGDDSAGGFGAQVEEEYAAYYKEHKPSPLSELEFVDTRKPISQVWDGGAKDDVGTGVMVEDTVDAALQRAETMFQAARERGDPDSPQSRALARMFRERARRGLEMLP